MSLVSNVTGSTTQLPQGATAYWSTNFFDPNGNLVTPNNATLSLSFFVNNQLTEASQLMTPPGQAGQPWTAQFDTRGIDPNMVQWSIHSYAGAGPPISVENGEFMLVANNATINNPSS